MVVHSRILLLIVACTSTACLRSTEFQCASNDQCSGGQCEAQGYCSVVDSACPAGRRFDASAGTYSNQCVGTDGVPDAGIEDSGPGCPATYVALPGVATHRYRVIAADGEWADQAASCTDDGPNVYLAIPDDATEIAALAAASPDDEVWVGIHDQTTEGTFENVKGEPQTFLPWEPGQPNNVGPGGQDCVMLRMSSVTLLDDRCSRDRPAICECED